MLLPSFLRRLAHGSRAVAHHHVTAPRREHPPIIATTDPRVRSSSTPIGVGPLR